VKEIQGIGGVVHVVNTLSDRNQTKQRTRSGRIASAVEERLCYLKPVGGRLDHVSVIPIHGEDVAIRSHRHAQRIIQTSGFRDGNAGMSRRLAGDRIGNRSNTI
jgi:hypothetical protein